MTPIRSTTILGVRDDKKVVLGGDGQVSLGDTVMKQPANKIRRMYDDRILGGFAGAAADGLTLFTLFESQLDEYRSNLVRAVVEFTKDWRSDRYLRQLEALLVVMDTQYSFVVSGNGNIIEPDDGITAIGSGGPYALAAARGLITHSELDARQIVKASLSIAASICVYTNDQLTIEELSI